jgi:transmembrane sensor
MIDPVPSEPTGEKAEVQAANWLWRLDRGLSPEEQDAFFDWLGTHPQNAEALARHRRDWKRLDGLADWRPEHGQRPNADLLAPQRSPRWWRSFNLLPLAAAAALVVAAGLWIQFSSLKPSSGAPAAVALKPENRQILADGSMIKLNDGAAVTVLYSPTERRIRLDRGEGFFVVNEDPARPFLVEARGLEVRAVGTAFNISLESGAVGVLVAHGTVRVASSPSREGASAPSTVAAPIILEASQRANISLTSGQTPPEITTLDRKETRGALAWQHRMMAFDRRPLSGIIFELNLLNEKQLIIGDTRVTSLQFSGMIRSDNVEGFVRLLEKGFGVRGEAIGLTKIVLYEK